MRVNDYKVRLALRNYFILMIYDTTPSKTVRQEKKDKLDTVEQRFNLSTVLDKIPHMCVSPFPASGYIYHVVLSRKFPIFVPSRIIA